MKAIKENFGLFFSIAAPMLAMCVMGGLFNGYSYATANRYFDEDMSSLGIQLIRAQVNRDLVFALASSSVLFILALLFLRRGRPAVSVLPYVYAVQLSLAGHRLLYSREWSVARVRYGFFFPGIDRRQVLLGGLWLLLALGAAYIFVARTTRRRKTHAGHGEAVFPGSTFSRGCTRAFMAVFGVSLAVNASTWFVPPEKPPRPFNVIWITWDSVRADHLSSYGYLKPTSPRLDAFAQDAVLFQAAISQHNWTRPSYASMLTSLHNWEFPRLRMRLSQLTLAEVLKNRGYRTFAYVQNPNLDAEFHFDQGFDSYVQLSGTMTPEAENQIVLQRFDSLVGQGQPFFLFVHYNEPHWPYRPDSPLLGEVSNSTASAPIQPAQIYSLMSSHGTGWDPLAPGAKEKVSYILDLYDASIRTTDAALGEVLAALKKRDLWDNSLIIFNSDHGDEFNDRGQFGHAHANLHPELTFVPLVIRFPKALEISPQKISVPVRYLDILPTVLGVVGIPPPSHLSGHNLLPLGELSSRASAAFSNVGSLVCLRTQQYSLVVDYGNDAALAFYDLLNDPAERTPLSHLDENPAFLQMKEKTDRWHAIFRLQTPAKGAGDSSPVSEELKEKLKALGYVQ